MSSFLSVFSEHALTELVKGFLHMTSGSVLQLSVEMAESEETRNFVRLELSDGDRVYVSSVWWTTNFSIVIFDGYQAWSHTGARFLLVTFSLLL